MVKIKSDIKRTLKTNFDYPQYLVGLVSGHPITTPNIEEAIDVGGLKNSDVWNIAVSAMECTEENYKDTHLVAFGMTEDDEPFEVRYYLSTIEHMIEQTEMNLMGGNSN